MVRMADLMRSRVIGITEPRFVGSATVAAVGLIYLVGDLSNTPVFAQFRTKPFARVRTLLDALR
jgi:hypothetical protein